MVGRIVFHVMASAVGVLSAGYSKPGTIAQYDDSIITADIALDVNGFFGGRGGSDTVFGTGGIFSSGWSRI